MSESKVTKQEYDETRAYHLLRKFTDDVGFTRKMNIQSYNRFLQQGICEIIAEESSIEVPVGTDQQYRVKFENEHLSSPRTVEDDRTTPQLTPHGARLRRASYNGKLSVDVVTVKLKKVGDAWVPTEQKRHEKVQIAEIPIMVGCCKCTLNQWRHMSPAEKLKYGECPQDAGGYFIIRGIERVVVPQERANYNTTLVFPQRKDKRSTHCAEIRSMSPTTGHSVLIKAMIGKSGRTGWNPININFSLPYINAEIPVGVVFTALGYDIDEIRALVTPPHERDDKYATRLQKCVDTIIAENVLPNGEECNKDSALEYMSNYAIHQLDNKPETKRAYVVQILENEILPHMGVISHNLERGVFLASIVRKLLETFVEKRPPDDRDNIANKRVETPGMLVGTLFRALFKRLVRSCAAQVQKRPDIIAAVQRFSASITVGLQSCFATGKWSVQKTAWQRQGVCQPRQVTTFGASLSHMRRIVIPLGKEGKNTAIRQIHGSQSGYVCWFETPEGHSSGIVKNFALLAGATTEESSGVVRSILEKTKLLLNIPQMKALRSEGELRLVMKYTKTYLNGSLVGVSPEPKKLCRGLRKIRRRGRISKQTSISYNEVDDEIFIYTDGGRLTRPLISLVDAKGAPKSQSKLHAREGEYIPFIDENLSWQELVAQGIIEHMCPSELENFAVATDPGVLQDAQKYRDPNSFGDRYMNMEYHFMEIHSSAMMGVCASIIPYPDHSQSPRNCYQSSMGKQALGIPMETHSIRADNEVHILMTREKPLVTTYPGQLLGFDDLPSGQNVMVAIATYGGHNQEDSIIINQGAVDRGLFRVVTYKTTTHQVKKGTNGHLMVIGVPPLDIRTRMKWYGSLEHDQTSPMYGVIKVGSTVNGEETALIGRFATFTSKDGQQKQKDSSIFSKSPHTGVVDKVILTSTPDGLPIYHIKVRYIRIPEVGDKFASREAQKGTCGRIMATADMPFTDDGMVPDIIVNPHCIPSRMTVNQLIESIASIGALRRCKRVDATSFTSNSTNVVEKLRKGLADFGLNPNGLVRMTNGMTGEPLKVPIFFGPVYYQRLKHMVSDKIHARAWGALQTMTRQPLEGRSRQGGLRFGEMERDCMISHGCSAFLHRRLLHCSDYFETEVCMKCYQWCNPNYCEHCKSDNVQRIMLPYAGKLLFNLLRGLGLKTQCVPWKLTDFKDKQKTSTSPGIEIIGSD